DSVHITVLAGANFVEGDAEFVSKETTHIKHHPEDSNRTCDGMRLRNNRIACHRHVITSRSGIVGHRRDHRFRLTGKLYLAPHHIRGTELTTRTVNPDYDGL